MPLQDEATDVLARLVRFRTVNPPGDERALQEWLRDYLAAAGFDVELAGAADERPNLVARLAAEDGTEGPVLGFLSHADTVLADPDDWEHDPWGAEVVDGHLWGRGSLDMKSQTAAEVVAAAQLARSGWRPARGELKIICVVDEETGGEQGAQWLTEQRPDLARCDYLVNEGGGAAMPYAGRRLYGVCCAEKGTFRFVVRARGRAGHASVPALGENALLKLLPAIERLGAGRPDWDVTDPPRLLLEALGEDAADPAAAIAAIAEREPRLSALVEPMLRITFAPTMIAASEKINVIPARAEARVDGRVPPGLGRADVERRLGEVMGGDGLEVEFVEEVVGNGSAVDTPLMDAIRDWAGEADPEAEVVPTILPAFTDSRWWRHAFPDCVAYGFFPHRHQSWYETYPLLHAPDERIDLRDLGLAAECYSSIMRRLLG